jgi:hypothetical protein
MENCFSNSFSAKSWRLIEGFEDFEFQEIKD